MRELKIHLAVGWNYYGVLAANRHILCHTPARDTQLTTDRDLVTCVLCKHFMKAYGDKYVIERGNAPRAVLNDADWLNAYRAGAPRYTVTVNGVEKRVKLVGGMVFLED